MPNIKDGASGYPIGNRDNSKRGRGKKKKGCPLSLGLYLAGFAVVVYLAYRATSALLG